MSDTRQKILETAREMFNEQGLHRVGVRDIARAVGITAGNLSYHFATKDHLVAALLQELHDRDARTVFATLPDDFSLLALYGAAVAVMRHMREYRFLLLSRTDAVRASPELRRVETDLWRARRRRSDTMLERLVAGGYLERGVLRRADYLFDQSELVSSGWLSAAALQPIRRSAEQVVLHFAKVGMVLLEPYCAPKGTRQMRAILAGEFDGRV